MTALMSAMRLKSAIRQADEAIHLLNQSMANLDNGKLFQQVIDVVQKESDALAPTIRNWVQQNYTAAGLGKWENHDKGLMQSEINKGVVAFRYKTTGKNSGKGWYIRFNLRPDAQHYTNKDGKKRNIFQVAHALSFGAVHTSGNSHLVEKSKYDPKTGKYFAQGNLGGTKTRATIKKAAIRAKALGVSGRLFDYMSFKQKMAFAITAQGHEPTLKKWRKGSKARNSIHVDVGTSGARMVVIPPRPWLQISATQKASVLSRVFKAIKEGIQKGEIHVS